MTTRHLTAKQVTDWQAAFAVTLTPAEVRLLTTDGALLGPYERQHQAILFGYMHPMECPACHLPTPARQALGRPVDFSAPSADDEFACVGCRRGLTRVMAVTGPTTWRLTRPLPPATDAELAGGAVGA